MNTFYTKAACWAGALISFFPLLQASNRAANTVILDESGVRNLRILTEEADYRNFSTTVFAIGRIEELPSHRAVLSTRVAGRVKAIHFFEGDYVKKGEVVARIETRQLGDPPPAIDLLAPQDGLVVTSHIRLGQPVEPDSELMDISDRSVMWAVARIPEQEAAGVAVGSKAHIRVPALGDMMIEGRLKRFGVNADRESGTVEGIFEIPNAEGRLRPGMRAEFSVVLQEREDVIAVPREAVQGDPSNRVVFVTDFDLDNAFVRVPVILGESNDRYVEVTSGLFPGDEVVTRGAYSLMFAGGGAGISLKEALDAAHGHEHNEDGSEMTDADRARKAAEARAARGDVPNAEPAKTSQFLMVYAALITLVSIILWQRLLQRKTEGAA
ncbi:efflux RND transporter periplasmic adaptor subunit [Coraliomargarita algicola]|uniref:Efflux RND transporter periplasmic adaptor subunit n=1 Tax=Coraliomargarita algicola TaxID=3092156 RepID=A0ABZ0RP34_9BACT|nr:efflux RND transporter periplasmic adaptor subunit [Coraliomargarita sp. J2-16]WPJ97877.1 efflux RND transporter periplasmic adaptor subunit [Coraliomargarita sp. J2-16]